MRSSGAPQHARRTRKRTVRSLARALVRTNRLAKAVIKSHPLELQAAGVKGIHGEALRDMEASSEAGLGVAVDLGAEVSRLVTAMDHTVALQTGMHGEPTISPLQIQILSLTIRGELHFLDLRLLLPLLRRHLKRKLRSLTRLLHRYNNKTQRQNRRRSEALPSYRGLRLHGTKILVY